MDSIGLDSDHKQCIISLINKIVAKSPHLSELKSDSILFLRLVSVISLIETTLCSKSQIVLKRNSTHNQSIRLIKSWLKQYYKQEFITSLCADNHQISQTSATEENTGSGERVSENGSKIKDESSVDNDYDIDYTEEAIDRDIALIALLILFIAHKLRQSLPRINAYFLPEWQTLSQLDSTLNKVLNFDKLLDLVQNELCIKRKQLEITKSQVLSLQSAINSRVLLQNKHKKTKLDFRSNLFAELEDNDSEGPKEMVDLEDNEEQMSEDSDGSPVFIDNSSDDDYKPIKPQNNSHKSYAKKAVKRGPKMKTSVRGRGRPSKAVKNSIEITPKMGPKSRVRTKHTLKPISLKAESEEAVNCCDEPFECETCGKRFAKEYRLVRHSFTHLGHKQFVCDFPNCSESFDLKWKLVDHKVEHSGGVEDESYSGANHSFRCEWADCGLELTSKRELTQHEHQMHANRSQSKYSCDWPQCREIFENKIDWRKHVKTHGKIVPTECGFPGCQKSFYKLDSLESHRKIHETFTLEELS